ncbi:MAG: glucan biosynthesis protein [bacterium]
MHLKVCNFLSLILLVMLAIGSLRAEDTTSNFARVCELAAARAAAPFQESAAPLPLALDRLCYDDIRCIEYDQSQTIWRAENLPFRMMMYHLGGPLLKQNIALHMVANGQSAPVMFDPKMFLYHQIPVNTAELPNTLGFAGFRLLNPLNIPDKYDELISFLGVSYFRALGKGQIYGTSARGLAVDSCCEEKEEFPRFISFWVSRPAANATNIVIDALLDSVRVCGAYRFTVQPGEDTIVDVQCVLYARHKLTRYGLGTLTSMYWFGENTVNHQGEFRPEVHDADGLLLARGDGTWYWRPLRNPASLQEQRLLAKSPLGFGLLQRDRRYTSYEDIEANYHKRPSVWVEPVGDWGFGYVMLAELPAWNEYGDNIVAYWQPSAALVPGKPLEAAWRLHWYMDNPVWPPLARTINSFVAGRRVVLDFAGGRFNRKSTGEPVPDITLDQGKLHGLHLLANPEIQGWRLGFEVLDTIAGKPVSVQVVLRDKAGNPLSETWTYPLVTH